MPTVTRIEKDYVKESIEDQDIRTGTESYAKGKEPSQRSVLSPDNRLSKFATDQK